MPTVQEALQQAVALQSQGKTREAAKVYEAVLKVEPTNADALHLLGLVASSESDYARAETLIRKALEFSPLSPVFHSNLGIVLRFSDRIEEAIAAYRTALRLDPSSPDAHYNLGKSLRIQGELEDAEQAFRKSIELSPGNYAPWLSLMNLYAERKQLEAAIQLGKQGLQYCPKNSQLHMNLAVLYKRLKQTEQTIAHYRTAVELSPRNVEAICRLANSLIAQHAFDEGGELLLRAQAIEAQSVHVHLTAGILQNALGEVESAETAFRAALAVDPEHANAYVHLGSVLRKQGKLTGALDAIEKAIKYESVGAEALANKGGILMGLGRLEEAQSCFKDSIEERESFRDSHANLLMCMQYDPAISPQGILDEHRDWNNLYVSELATRRDFTMSRDPGRPLRLGFVSADLGMHPVGYFTVKLFESLDQQEFKTVIYSDRAGKDPLATRIAASVSQWNDVAGVSDETLAERIIEGQIDVLFDLAGHTNGNRLPVFARRAAPIQISWAGYVGTTGLAEMDYILADRFHVPVELERNSCEKILRLPHGYVTYEPPADTPDISPLPALSNGFITFAAMCNPAKVNDEVLHLWFDILRQMDDSRLLLCYTGWPDDGNQQRIRKIFGETIAADRVEFRQCDNSLEVMQTYGLVDIALDTFPYSGGLTTCEALWMGVPTITFPGDRFAGRHSFSHLSNVGLSQCIADSREAYVARAIWLGSDIDSLSQLRSELRTKLSASPLCNGPMFARDFAKTLRDAWRDWCESE